MLRTTMRLITKTCVAVSLTHNFHSECGDIANAGFLLFRLHLADLLHPDSEDGADIGLYHSRCRNRGNSDDRDAIDCGDQPLSRNRSVR